MQCKWTFTKALLFLRHRENFPWKHALCSQFLKSYSGGVVFEFAKGCAFCHPLQLFLIWSIIQCNYYCELQTTQPELDLNYPYLRLRCSHISLCGLNLTSQNLVGNVFYTVAIRNSFSFHKLVTSIFRALSTNKS